MGHGASITLLRRPGGGVSKAVFRESFDEKFSDADTHALEETGSHYYEEYGLHSADSSKRRQVARCKDDIYVEIKGVLKQSFELLEAQMERDRRAEHVYAKVNGTLEEANRTLILDSGVRLKDDGSQGITTQAK